MLRFAHRGASGYEPENTLASFKKALQLGVEGIELDVHVTKDGNVVVIHDGFLYRTTKSVGFINGKTLAELKQLDAGNGEKIPTLQEVLDLIDKKALINIELKGKGTALPVSTIINDYVRKKGWKYSDFLVSSFNQHELRVFKQLMPQIKISMIIIGILIRLDKYVKLNAYAIALWSKFAKKTVIDNAHEKGLKVYVYTVNNKEEIKKMKAYGIDGIFSNYPDRV